MIVLDASAAVDFLLRREPYETVAQLVRGHDIHSPELLTVEVLHTLRRFEQHGELTAERVAEAVDDLVDLPMEYYPVAPTALAIWALRHEVTPYDASYVVLAAGLGARLVTTDQPLGRTARRHCRVVAL